MKSPWELLFVLLRGQEQVERHKSSLDLPAKTWNQQKELWLKHLSSAAVDASAAAHPVLQLRRATSNCHYFPPKWQRLHFAARDQLAPFLSEPPPVAIAIDGDRRPALKTNLLAMHLHLTLHWTPQWRQTLIVCRLLQHVPYDPLLLQDCLVSPKQIL